jgi:glycosyltransferase involved in cell wall biosynthesis
VSTHRPKVAFVIHRCGVQTFGGAESLCLQLAQHLGTAWDIDVLTTCAQDYMTWENVYPEGHTYEQGVHIQRFKVDRPRDLHRFNGLSERIRFDVRQANIALQEEWVREEGPNSSGLREYVERHRYRYDAFFFFTYIYATTYGLLPLVEEKAFLVPVAHDEWPLQMRIWDEFFQRPVCTIFNTPEEHDFVQARFDRAAVDGPVIGCGIEAPPYVDAGLFRARYGIDEPFMLYLGRVDPSKGCGVLVEDFIRFRRRHAEPVKLVLAGELQMAVPNDANVTVTGPIDEFMKWSALAGCDLLAMPSPLESLSLAVLEAWSMGKATLVNAHSPALVGQCRRSGAGLWYANYDEFEAALTIMDEPVRKTLGSRGMDFIKQTCSWTEVEAKYRKLLESPMQTADSLIEQRL